MARYLPFDVDPGEATKILNVVSMLSRVTTAQIMGWSRLPEHSRARQVAQYLILTRIGQGRLAAVARYFGCDHTTVRHTRAVMRREIATSGLRAGMFARAAARLDQGIDAKPFRKAPSAIGTTARPRPDYIPLKAKRITASGWMDHDGSLVCRP